MNYMKNNKLILLLLTVLMLLGGCKKNPNPNPKPTPDPKPEPTPVVDYVESALGTRADVEQLLKDFNEHENEYTAFYAFDYEGKSWYCVWDDTRVYQGNVEQYMRNNQYPIIDFYINYSGEKINYLQAFIPTMNIRDVNPDNAKFYEEFEKKILHFLLPDLDASGVEKLMKKIYLTDEDGFKAYNKK